MQTGSWITVTILLAILATLLQIAGYVAPMWIWLEVDTFRVGVGLWYRTGCAFEGTCNTTAPSLAFGYSSEDTSAKPQYNAVRGLLTVGVAGGVLLVLFLIVYKIGYGQWTQMGQLNLTAFITCVLTWLCILAGLIVYCAYYWPVVGTSPLLNRMSFPWSLVMCLLAALFFIIVCVLIRVKCRDRNFLKHAIPTSGDSKMDLNPVTKQGILHRYFTPLHYNDNRRLNFAIGYHDEGTTVPGMNRRLIGGDERHVTAIDNVAFQGNRLDNGVNYRYLPAHNGGVTHSETVVRRSLPTAVVTYTETSHQDANRLSGGGGIASAQNIGNHHVTETSTNQVLHTGRDLAYQHENGDVTRDVAFMNGIAGDARRNVTRQTSAGTSPRDSGVLRGQGAGVVTLDAEYSTVTRPLATSSTAYIAGVTTTAGARESRVIADHSTDARFTNEGRLMADAEYLVNTETRRSCGGGAAMSQVGSNHSGGLMQYTTHTTQSLATRTVLPTGGSVKMYDPTYIYRPYSEQQIY